MNRQKNLKITYNVTGMAVIIFLAVREMCGAVLSRIPFSEGSALPLFINTAVFLAAVLVPVTFMENTLGMHPKLFRKSGSKSAGPAVFWGYLLILAASFLNSIVLIALNLAGLEFAKPSLNIPQNTFAAVIYFIYVCVLPPVLEEIFTRGYILNAFRGFGTTFAVIVSSVCFALMHSSLENFVVYFCCGVILALLYLTFDSIYPAIALHFINNSVSFFLTSFQNRVNAVSALSLITIIYFCIIVLGIGGKMHLDKEKTRLGGCMEKDAHLFKKLRTAFAAPVGLTAFCLLLFFAVLGSYDNLI